MKSLITDAIGLVGYGLLVAGIYLQYGLAPSLMFAGGFLLTLVLLAVWRRSRAI